MAPRAVELWGIYCTGESSVSKQNAENMSMLYNLEIIIKGNFHRYRLWGIEQNGGKNKSL